MITAHTRHVFCVNMFKRRSTNTSSVQTLKRLVLVISTLNMMLNVFTYTSRFVDYIVFNIQSALDYLLKC